MNAERESAARLRHAMNGAMILGVMFIVISFSIGVWKPIPGVVAGQGEWTVTTNDFLSIIVFALVFPCAIWSLSLARRLDAIETGQPRDPRK